MGRDRVSALDSSGGGDIDQRGIGGQGRVPGVRQEPLIAVLEVSHGWSCRLTRQDSQSAREQSKEDPNFTGDERGEDGKISGVGNESRPRGRSYGVESEAGGTG